MQFYIYLQWEDKSGKNYEKYIAIACCCVAGTTDGFIHFLKHLEIWYDKWPKDNQNLPQQSEKYMFEVYKKCSHIIINKSLSSKKTTTKWEANN